MSQVLFDIISYPVLTEKTTADVEKGKYTFRVHPRATKGDIRLAVEQAFNVSVVKVNVSNVFGKLKRIRYQPGYAADWKKAIVTLKSGQKIEFTV